MTGTQAAFDGFGEAPARTGEIAGVLVDVDLAHLDRPLDYAVPEELSGGAQVGRLVRVTLAGSRANGWIVSRRRGPIGARMAAVERVVSDLPVTTPAQLELASRIALRFLATSSQVLSVAVPARHARAERAVIADLSAPRAPAPTAAGEGADSDQVWSGYPAGAALAAHLARGEAPKAVWTALPGRHAAQIADLVRATRRGGRSALVVAPTAEEAEWLAGAIEAATGERAALMGASVGPEERYAAHLRCLNGLDRIVVGTRSAVWAPVRDLGLVVVWGDGDDRLREQRAPRCDALDVAVQRCVVDGCALVVGSFSRSVKAHALVRSGWAVGVEAVRDAVRAATPRVRLYGSREADRTGEGRVVRFPSQALRLVRRACQGGAVLIQVASAGYVPVVSCQRCRTVARCPSCHGPLGLGAEGSMRCGWCGRAPSSWRCPHCSGTRLRALRVGADRTAEEVARALPEASVLESSAAHRVTRRLPARPGVVVATAAAEPAVEGGYAAGVVLDAQAVAGRPELWAPEEAVRRWFNAFALVRPGGDALVVGDLPDDMGQALVRWAPSDYADRLLDEREALGFFPAMTLVALDGDRAQVAQVADQCAREAGAEVVGTVPAPRRSKDSMDVRAIVRVPRDRGLRLLEVLTGVRQARASKKSPPVTMSVNPPELF